MRKYNVASGNVANWLINWRGSSNVVAIFTELEDPFSAKLRDKMSDDSGLESGGYDWNTEDELEIESFHSSCIAVPNGQTSGSRSLEENTFAAGPSNTKVFDCFINMGFRPELVSKVIQEYGEENEDKLIQELLTYQELESSSQQQQQVEPDPTSSEYAASSWDDSSDEDFFSDEEMPKSCLSENDDTLLSLVKMGFNEEEALMAVKRLGPNSSLEELVDFISVAQLVKSEDALLPPEEKVPQCNGHTKPRKRSLYEYEVLGRKRPKVLEKRTSCDDEDEAQALHLPNPMVGFGIPTDPSSIITYRRLPHDASGPPYFYYENVALTPKARKRGYIHNLPIANSAKLTQRIRKAVEQLQDFDDPPENVKKFVLEQCRKWNLVWVGKNKVAPLEPDEVEMLLGFPRNHTRGGGISRTDRFKSLGNSFQVDTVAYHLSVLKEMFPYGINVLSLFSGIGGAEVALHRLGIPLKTVVSVEKSEVNRNIVRSWWEQTNQRGNLIDMDDVQQLDADRLEQLMSTFGAFDLIVGGSPCNNLAGSNRVTRTGLEGSESSLFYDYFRIIDLVKVMAPRFQGNGL
ncbi:unnamed protein product [Vicia faba]|uniref:DNA (cytosine-5-)-methyltransferase n=1 Tax=Vicia faba TaxID=3906 RepID=A0AAV0Z9R1_VICFA|nr:unnamed protein product [Vicia faba]